MRRHPNLRHRGSGKRRGHDRYRKVRRAEWVAWCLVNQYKGTYPKPELVPWRVVLQARRECAA